jgi:hypothetical protein
VVDFRRARTISAQSQDAPLQTPPTGPAAEVHWDALEDGSYERVADYTSDFSPADADNGT